MVLCDVLITSVFILIAKHAQLTYSSSKQRGSRRRASISHSETTLESNLGILPGVVEHIPLKDASVFVNAAFPDCFSGRRSFHWYLKRLTSEEHFSVRLWMGLGF